MGQPVIFMYMARMNKSWFEMSEVEQAAMMEKVGASRDAVGGKGIVMADCAWSNPDWQFFGVEEYPSVGALRKHYLEQQAMGFLDHVEEDYIVGVPWEDDDS